MADRSPSGCDYQPPAEGWKEIPSPPGPKNEIPGWLMDRTVRRWLVRLLNQGIRVLMGWRDWLLTVPKEAEELEDPLEPIGQEPFLLEEIEEEDLEPPEEPPRVIPAT